MDARGYRTKITLSGLDFPAINGPIQQSNDIRTEPPTIVDGRIALKITAAFVITNVYTNHEHIILSGQSVYEIPASKIITREDVYEFYKDAALGINEAYQRARTKIQIPDMVFTIEPIEAYQQEIDGVFYLLNSRN